jgi:RNA polymerase sigma-70 factor (ECF subfamily)
LTHATAAGLDALADERLAAAAKRGDREAIGRLWERHRRWVAAVLLAHKPSFEDLDDLLQDVAMTLVCKVNTLREEANLQAWLRTVAINVARAAGRGGKYRPRAPLPDVDRHGGDASADTAVLIDEQMRRTLRRVAQLPDAYREPLLLRAMHDMPSRQIGELLDIPPATVDTRIARARRMLLEQAALRRAATTGTPG